MRFIIYGLLLLLALYKDIRVIYLLFVFILFKEFHKKKKLTKDILLAAAIYSVILPDNYSTELFLILFFLGNLFFSKVKISFSRDRYTLFTAIFIALALFTTIIHGVPIINVFFSVISFIPFLIFLFTVRDVKGIEYKNIIKYLNEVFWIETLATVINFVFFYRLKIDDWSSGTFSKSGGQQAQLFIIAAYMTFFYIALYKKNKDNKQLLKSIIMAIVAFSTNCWTLLLMLVLGIFITYITSLEKKRIAILVIAIIMIPGFIRVSEKILPDKITNTINRMLSDQEYFRYRFYKVQVYEDTFVNIPREDLDFLLIGNGVGYYNSRAALICTGRYVEFYEKYFKPSMSEYTKQYIYGYLSLGFESGGSDYGSILARPYSAILALMGECGYLGCILFLFIIISLTRNRNIMFRMIINIWLSVCLMENYFEYSKIIIVLLACAIVIEHTRSVSEKDVYESQSVKGDQA